MLYFVNNLHRGEVNAGLTVEELDYTNNYARAPFSYSGNPTDYYVSNYVPTYDDFTTWLTTRNLLIDDLNAVLEMYSYGVGEWCFSPGPCWTGQALINLLGGLNQFLVNPGIAQLLGAEEPIFSTTADECTLKYGNGYFYVEGRWHIRTIFGCVYPNVRSQFYVYYDESGTIIREVLTSLGQNIFTAFEERVAKTNGNQWYFVVYMIIIHA